MLQHLCRTLLETMLLQMQLLQTMLPLSGLVLELASLDQGWDFSLCLYKDRWVTIFSKIL